MAQQQPRREEFGNAPRAQEQQERERERDVRKNEMQESDRWKEEFGTRAGAPDPAAPYAFATGYGAPADSGGVDVASGPHGITNFGAPPSETGGVYENTTSTATAAFGTNDDPATGNRNRNRDDKNMNMNMNRNRGRDQI